ncbi:MAG: LytR family transcriptional regulator [Nocardioidaceae bacterium]|nr:LytR family transcriptional regulator [Nocardioidaceae bacterium]
MSQHASRRHGVQSRGRRALKRMSVVLAAVVLVVGALGVYFYKHLEGNINGVSIAGDLGTRPKKLENGKQAPLNILVMGSDTRKGQGKQIQGSTPGLSDTTILLHLSADRQSAYGVSIPRDTMVERPSCRKKDGKGIDPGGTTQFNAAFAIGGAACTQKTVESITGVYIDHYVVVDFNGFRKMVDALGGVQVCVPEEVNDTDGKIHLAAGTYNVTGEQALDYVRVRHGISANGDIGRIKRQQTFIAAMIKKGVSAGTLANPVKLVKFLDAATSSLTTDPGFAHLKQLASLGSSLQNIGLSNVKFITAPWEPYTPDPNRVQLTPEADVLWKQIRLDKPLSSTLSKEVVTAADNTPGTATSTATPTSPNGGIRTDLLAAQAGAGTLKDNVVQSADDKEKTAEENGLCT